MEPDINSAIKHGFLQQVRFLIEYGHSINKRDEELRTPLINCAFIQNEKWGAGLARLFIEKGANMSLRDKLGLNALHYACIYGRLQLVEIYLNALDFNINAVDRYGNTPLHYAAATGNMDVIRAMASCCKKYGLSVDKANKKGETALALAWKSGYHGSGNMLIHIGGADADIEDNDGKSAREWLNETPPKTGNAATNHFRPQTARIKQRTALSNIKVSSVPLRSQSRPTTALSGTKQNPYTAVRQQSVDPVKRQFSLEQRHENNVDDSFPDKVRRATNHCYVPASDNDHRNSPQYIFQVSPAEYFSNSDVNTSTYPLAGFHSARHMKAKKEDPVNRNWRNAVKQYFSSFDYQFAHSYRRSAIPPEPEPEEILEERVESPVPSEMGDSEISSVAGRKGSKSKDKQEKRKSSQSEKHDVKGLSRKVSTLAPPSRNEAGQNNMDSSSSESINGKRGDRVKSAKPGSRDGNQSRAAVRK